MIHAVKISGIVTIFALNSYWKSYYYRQYAGLDRTTWAGSRKEENRKF